MASLPLTPRLRRSLWRVPVLRRLLQKRRLEEARYRASLAQSDALPSGDLEARYASLRRAYWAYRVFRPDILRQLIVLELRRGRPVAAAAYHLRLARNLRLDARDDLLKAADLLISAGRPFHARRIAEYMLTGAIPCRPEALARAAELAATLHDPPLPDAQIALTLESRPAPPPPYRVAVIFSLYKEAARIERAVETYTRQTLYQQGRMELIFVDSASPTDERTIFHRLVPRLPHLLYVRTDVREPLYAAWNRAAALARAPYLCFTTPSELLFDTSLERMADALDAAPDADWLQGNVGVSRASDRTDLDTADGTLRLNSTHGFTPFAELVAEDYLNFTYSLVRREAFDRAGRFDPRFITGGDTDLKMRFVGHGRVCLLDAPLGFVLEETGPRLTVQPLAEVEHFIAEKRYTAPEHLRRIGQANGTPDPLAALVDAAVGLRRASRDPDAPRNTALEIAHDAARQRLLASPEAPEAWNDAAVTGVWSALTAALDAVSHGQADASTAAVREANRQLLWQLLRAASALRTTRGRHGPGLNDVFDRPYPYAEQIW